VARLFRKTWKVVIAAQPTGFVGQNPQFFETLGNAVEIVDMRVAFSVTKNLGKEPNKCSLQLYNLNDHTRGMLERTPVRIWLHGGYDGAARLLFTGDLRFSHTRIDGSDVVTSVEVRDGMRAFAHARMTRSYKPPIRVSQVLGDAAASMGLTLPPEIERSPELKQALATGISMHGPTRDILTRLLAPYGYSWSIQDGTLVVLADGKLRPGEAILVNEATGLVGSPERSVPDKPGARASVSFETLLYPEIAPGMAVKLESRFINGVFRVKEVGHEGDSHDGEWKTTVKADPT
jgi:hypothetical protein